MSLLAGLSQNSSPSLKPVHPFIADSESGASFFQLASLLEQIQRATLEAKNLVSAARRTTSPARLKPGSWSAAECLDHLARTTRSFLPAISKAVATAPKLTTNRAFRTGTIALLLIRNLEPPYRLRYKVLPNWCRRKDLRQRGRRSRSHNHGWQNPYCLRPGLPSTSEGPVSGARAHYLQCYGASACSSLTNAATYGRSSRFSKRSTRDGAEDRGSEIARRPGIARQHQPTPAREFETPSSVLNDGPSSPHQHLRHSCHRRGFGR